MIFALSKETVPFSYPAGREFNVAFALHFDHPLDHQASRFMLVAGTGTRLTVPVRLGAQPNVLYGSVGKLAAGSYVLNWSARSSDGVFMRGTLPFVVGSVH